MRVSGTDDWMELNRLISLPAAEPAVAAESSVAEPSGQRASSSGKVDAMEALGAGTFLRIPWGSQSVYILLLVC